MAERRREPSHLLLKRLAIVLDNFSSHVTSGRKHMAVLADFLQRRGIAESRHVSVLSGSFVTAPGVVRTRDLGNVCVGKLPMDAISENPQLAGVNK